MTESTITGTSRFGGGGEPVPFTMTLFEHHSGFYGCDPDEAWGDGGIVVGWKTDGDNPGAGFLAEPASGPVQLITFRGPPAFCAYRGIRVTRASDLAIDLAGGFGGVAGPLGSAITVEIRQNGTVIYSEMQSDPSPGLHFWGGAFAITSPIIATAAGDELEVSVVFTNWVDYQYFATQPGNANANTHFRVTGETTDGSRGFLRGHGTFAASL